MIGLQKPFPISNADIMLDPYRLFETVIAWIAIIALEIDKLAHLTGKNIVRTVPCLGPMTFL